MHAPNVHGGGATMQVDQFLHVVLAVSESVPRPSFRPTVLCYLQSFSFSPRSHYRTIILPPCSTPTLPIFCSPCSSALIEMSHLPYSYPHILSSYCIWERVRAHSLTAFSFPRTICSNLSLSMRRRIRRRIRCFFSTLFYIG